MYACGPTVYDQPHIGHARSAYIFDVIRRYLIKYKEYKVKFVRNITDVDDKIINKAKEEFKDEDLNSAVKKVADKYLAAYHEALRRLGISTDPGDIIEPRASEYIEKIKAFINTLIEKKVAYQSGADVYFDITKAKNYGKLSNQSIEAMEAGARVAPTENKKNPLDFALWKSAKEGEPSWDSPWGKGRPGWHIECSVMSTDILGDQFDIHGGGLDLIFPHHENEIAQAEGAGKKFAQVWMHHGLLTINGQKMAKSLGNFVTLQDFEKEGYDLDTLKLFFLLTHYSHPADFTWKSIKEKKENLKSFQELFYRVSQREKSGQYASSPDIKAISISDLKTRVQETREGFKKHMDNDFDTQNATALLFELRNDCNRVLYSTAYTKEYLPALKSAVKTIKEIGEFFGLSFALEQEMPKAKMEQKEIESLIKSRKELKKKKKFKEADQIRKELEENGILLEDTRDGRTEWRVKI